MSLRILFLLVCSAVAAFGASENIERTLASAPGGRLVVDVDFGSIDVQAGADDKVEVQAFREVKMRDEAKEKEYLAEVPVEFAQEGNTVTVRAVRKKNEDRRVWRHVNTKGRYTIKVPKNFNLKLETSGGEIEAHNLLGTVEAETSGGNLEFTNIEGPVQGETSGGHIAVREGSGKLDLSTSGGHIKVNDYRGDAILETSGGSLRLDRIHGRLVGETSGGSIDAVLPSPMAGDVRLETSGGSINLSVPATAGIDVKAETSAGRVSTDLPFEGKRDADSLVGKLNGGGRSVVLSTSAGSIRIKAAGAEVANQQ